MNKRIICMVSLLFCVLLTFLSLTSCGTSKADPALVGHWESDNSDPYLFVFNENGTGRLFDSLTTRSFTYTVKDGTVSFSYDVDYDYVLESAKYTIENHVLTLVSPDGNTRTYTNAD